MPKVEFPDIGRVIEALAAGSWAATKALAPGGTSPTEAFSKEFDKIMGGEGIDQKALGGAFSGRKPLLVGEMGPELIIPSGSGQVLNAQRTQQMLQAGMARGMGGGAGGGITSVNTGGNVVSAPTTNYVNNGIAARRPILLTA